ncbi:MAG: decaprenyl-phosphate phosphoribosyltransferase [Ignavibacteriaceae bacterium]|nr:decaprenyl-phosphate phosphoribosyltransferase [Ignavibacteriaceae bacterium]
MSIEIIKLIRLPQWIKNLFVFVPILFSKHLFVNYDFLYTLYGFFILCFSSSLIYVINDLIDIEADRAHPFKKNRPLASGKVSKSTAFILVAILVITIAATLPFFDLKFAVTVLLFISLNVLYSFFLKHLVILDIFSIAAGFSLRVLAGAFIINVEISSWLILTTMFISLFLGVMKRHSELNLVTENSSGVTRKVLSQYSINFADQISTIAAAGVIICYALYTVADRTILIFETEHLIYTTPFVVFGIFRYMYLVYLKDEGENTTKIMLSDLPMIITVLLYIIITFNIIYFKL